MKVEILQVVKVQGILKMLAFNVLCDWKSKINKKSILISSFNSKKKSFSYQFKKNFENYFVFYRKTSFINGREYVPFMSVDMKEKFAYPVPYR